MAYECQAVHTDLESETQGRRRYNYRESREWIPQGIYENSQPCRFLSKEVGFENVSFLLSGQHRGHCLPDLALTLRTTTECSRRNFMSLSGPTSTTSYPPTESASVLYGSPQHHPTILFSTRPSSTTLSRHSTTPVTSSTWLITSALPSYNPSSASGTQLAPRS